MVGSKETARRLTKTQIRRMVKSESGILLDISWGGDKQQNAIRLGPGGDIDHNPLEIPFPLPSGVVWTAVITHILEYLEPSQWFPFWDELHRVMRPGGIVYVSGPYGGDESLGWLSDPTHRTRVTEQAVAWLDPRLPYFNEHPNLGRPQPKPWHALALARVPGMNGTISYNFTLQSQQVKA